MTRLSFVSGFTKHYNRCMSALLGKIYTTAMIFLYTLTVVAMEVLIKYRINSLLRTAQFIRWKIDQLPVCLNQDQWLYVSVTDWPIGKKHASKQEVDQFSIKWIDQLEERNWCIFYQHFYCINSNTSLKAHFHSGKFSAERKFCEMWLADTNFPSEKNFEVELLTTSWYFRNFLSVENWVEMGLNGCYYV